MRIVYRYLVPTFFGVALYILIYILHYFNEMEWSLRALLYITIPVVLVFEITRLINDFYSTSARSAKPIITALKVFLISLSGSLIVIMCLYLWEKQSEINQGAEDSIGYFHLLSMAIQVLIIVLAANAYHQIRHYAQALYRERTKTLRLEAAQTEARLSSLQNQLSPHFLFNNLNTLYGLVDNERAKLYVKNLADLYRSLLLKKNEEVIPLKEEITYLKEYLYLLKVRFEDLISVTIDVDASEPGCIPPFTLQLLIENTIKHNKFSEDSPLNIEVKRHNNRLTVSNNYRPKATDHSLRLGLKNMIDRFHLLTDQPVYIQAQNMTFEVSVPLMQMSND